MTKCTGIPGTCALNIKSVDSSRTRFHSSQRRVHLQRILKLRGCANAAAPFLAQASSSCIFVHGSTKESHGSQVTCGEPGFWSVIIPTYNRLPILLKCLAALEQQTGLRQAGIADFEVLVVDDGSADATVPTIAAATAPHAPADDGASAGALRLPHVRLLQQSHGGAAAARNTGVQAARGSVVVFLDSDMVVSPGFLAAHAAALRQARACHGDDCSFSYGRVVNTSDFEAPEAEPFKLTDLSAAFFATGNVAIHRHMLTAAAALLPAVEAPADSGPTGGAARVAGPFNTAFSDYGWEDLELGERLRQCGARIWHCPAAVGFHWHPPFSVARLPQLIDQERQRGRNGVRFLRLHPSLRVRLMVQLTPLHAGLWAALTLSGWLDERRLAGPLRWLEGRGQAGLAAALVSPLLNWHTVRAAQEELRREEEKGVEW